MGKGRKRHWTDEEFAQAVKKSKSFAGVFREIGLRPTGGNYTTAYRMVERMGLDISHFTGQAHNKGKILNINQAKPLEEILVKNSNYCRAQLKRRLLDNGLLKNECYLCGLQGEWQGKPLTMVLDHINGVNDDNRLENLRLLCPNCNSQTSTFCAHNVLVRYKEGNQKVCSICGRTISRSKSGKCAKCVKKSQKFISKCPRCGGDKSKKADLCMCCFRVTQKKVKDRPSKEKLRREVYELGFREMNYKYGVSDNTIREWIKTE